MIPLILIVFFALCLALYMADAPAPTEQQSPPPKPIMPTVGRIVNYVLPHGASRGRVVPAVIVRTWGNDTCINLLVLLDGFNDREAMRPAATPVTAQRDLVLVEWATSALRDDSGKQPGSWHWMPYQVGQAAKTDGDTAQLRSTVTALTDIVADLSRRLAVVEGRARALAPIADAELHPQELHASGAADVDLSKLGALVNAPATDAGEAPTARFAAAPENQEPPAG